MKIYLGMLFLTLFLSAGEIKVAAAANVGAVLKELINEFNSIYPNVKVNTNIASSGKLTALISQGAPYDIFMSADMKYPKIVYEKGFAFTRALVYARGSLVYFSLKKRDFSKKAALLEDGAIEQIAVANPKTAPYGKAAKEALENIGIYEKVKKKFIYGESISQTLTYAFHGADIAIVAKSSLFSPGMKKFKEHINWQSVDPSRYLPLNQGVVILKNGAKKREAAAFFAFIFSKEAKKIFENFGYEIP